MKSTNARCFSYEMELIIIKFSMSTGAATWFRMFEATVWKLLIIETGLH